jgi:hypothetical protein
MRGFFETPQLPPSASSPARSPHRRCRTAWTDLGERWSSRLVATAEEDRLSFRHNAQVRLRQPAIAGTIAICQYTPLETNFDEFSACPDAEAVFGGVIGVAVIVAPRDILLMIHMATDRPRDQNDGCADDESPSYQLCHF